jgi:hypothetical protein
MSRKLEQPVLFSFFGDFLRDVGFEKLGGFLGTYPETVDGDGVS